MTRPAATLQRLERILLMVPWLLEHQGASVAEVTERFGLSRDALARDLDVLGYCGLPGYGGGDLIEASLVGDRVVVRMADFFRRPLRLSVREAVTLLLAARAFAGVEGLPESEPLRSAVATLEGLLGGEARVAMDVGLPVAGVAEHAGDAAAGAAWIASLRAAVTDGNVVRLTYRSASKGEHTERDVEPWALSGVGGAWYLQGWCRLARGPRDFRLDRVRDLVVTPERVTAERPGEVAAPAYQPSPEDTEVVLRLAPHAWWVAEQLVVDTVTEQRGWRWVTFRTPALAWVERLVLGLGPDAVRVVSPPELDDGVRALARRALARYDPGEGTDPGDAKPGD